MQYIDTVKQQTWEAREIEFRLTAQARHASSTWFPASKTLYLLAKKNSLQGVDPRDETHQLFAFPANFVLYTLDPDRHLIHILPFLTFVSANMANSTKPTASTDMPHSEQ